MMKQTVADETMKAAIGETTMKNRNFKLGGLVAILMLTITLLAAPAAATCTASWSTGVTVNTTRSDHQATIEGTSWQAQTFTATGTGCLGQITINVEKVGNPGNLILGIYDVTVDGQGQPLPVMPSGLGGTASALAEAVLAPGDVPTSYQDVTVSFGTPPPLVNGAQYAVVVHALGANGQNTYRLGLSADNPYAGGRFCKSSTSGWDCPSGPGGGLDVKISFCVSPCTTGCTLTQGYWKNHPGNWPVTTLSLGSTSYVQSSLLTILDTSVSGNGLVSLAHQLIAAKLNVANGASAPAAVQSAITSADAMIGALVVPAIGSGYLHPSVTSGLTEVLDTFNNGLTPGGPPHCSQ